MNIMIAVTTMTHINGGVCTQIVDLCQAMPDDHIVLVADGSDYVHRTSRLPNVTYIDMPFFDSMKSLKDFRACSKRLRQICVEHKIDIIHVNGQRLIPLAWRVKRKLKIPFLWTNHIDSIPQGKLFLALARIMKFPIISVSTDLKNYLIQEYRVPARQITVITNGVDTNLYPPLTEAERADLREKFQIREGDYVISEVARLTYGKGQDCLVRAVKTLTQAHPDRNIKLLFAGTGHQEWFEANVMDYAREHGLDCQYLGFQSPREVFGVSDLAVLPSLYEGFALVCTEALSMECPVVRSDSPGHTDMRDVTLVHQKGDLPELTERLEYAMTHPDEMRAMARLGRKKCETVFSIQEMARRTKQVYQAILEGKYPLAE